MFLLIASGVSVLAVLAFAHSSLALAAGSAAATVASSISLGLVDLFPFAATPALAVFATPALLFLGAGAFAVADLLKRSDPSASEEASMAIARPARQPADGFSHVSDRT
jgi:hypothetical protein